MGFTFFVTFVKCDSRAQGDINEFTYEMKHCATKRQALKNTGQGGIRRVVENLLVDELSLLEDNTGRKTILEKVIRNHKAIHDDRAVREKMRHRRRALLSMNVVGGCIEASGVLDSAHVCTATGVCTVEHQHTSDICDDEALVSMFKNMYHQPTANTNFDKEPTFPDYEGSYVSPLHMGKLIKWDKKNSAKEPVGDDEENADGDDENDDDDDDDMYDAEDLEGGRVNDSAPCDADDAPGNQGAPCQATDLANEMDLEEEEDWAEEQGQHLTEELSPGDDDGDEGDDEDDAPERRGEQEAQAAADGEWLTQALSPGTATPAVMTRTGREVRPPRRLEGYDHGLCHGGSCH